MGAPRRRAPLHKKLLLLAGSLVFVLVLAEVAVRIFWSSLAPPGDVVTNYRVGERPFGGRGFYPAPNARFESRYDGDPYHTLPEDNVVHYRLNELGLREPVTELVGQLDGPLGIIAPVALEDDVHIITHGLADGSQVGDLLPDGQGMVVEIDVVVLVESAEADGGDAFRRALPGLLSDLISRAPGHVAV